ncbi:MAG TPA: discoidin domain-containing protein [Terriglobales bacterium]|nr:discoidin domain-containing protein [Terriglobales bacterium]
MRAQANCNDEAKPWTSSRWRLLVMLASGLSLAVAQTPPGNSAGDRITAIRVDAAHAVKKFDPNLALGTSIDILRANEIDKVYSEAILKESLSAGWGPITYRQNTELQGAAWHWNPNGTWSNPVDQRGYFTGSAQPGEFIRHSYGYPLPHRGNTHGDGRSPGKYSRITDGDPNTYWKSNPYLSSQYTGEDDALHPQWVVVDLGAPERIDTLRIDWANPYATAYEVQSWNSEKDPLANPTEGAWIVFPEGIVSKGKGGTETLRLSPRLTTVRYLRLWMTKSSNTSEAHDQDPRSSAGYAIRELYIGTWSSDGQFVDLVKHVPDQNQTVVFTSSVDPWHSASDFTLEAGDQTGLDLFYTSGMTNKLPAMIPIAMLYGTPDDAAAEIAYVLKRGYPISYIEMGEEPDGQKMLPEDYAALYLEFAQAIHRVDPNLKLGGPVFEGVSQDIQVWPDAKGRASWLGRFLDYLKEHGRISDLSFVSFEHYPYAPCEVTWSDLYREPDLTKTILQVWRSDGVPANVPLMNTESNLSWGLTQPMTDIFASLWLADSVGAFLTFGGDVYYHSPIQPEALRPGCRGWSTYGNFVADQNLNIRGHTAQYYASRLINLEWVEHGRGEHLLYRAASDLTDGAERALITVYPVLRPDGDWSLLVINKDQSNSHTVQVQFEIDGGNRQTFSGPVTMITFGSDQYAWHSDGVNSRAEPENPPVTRTLAGRPDASFTLPRASVTVLRGRAGSR